MLANKRCILNTNINTLSILMDIFLPSGLFWSIFSKKLTLSAKTPKQVHPFSFGNHKLPRETAAELIRIKSFRTSMFWFFLYLCYNMCKIHLKFNLSCWSKSRMAELLWITVYKNINMPWETVCASTKQQWSQHWSVRERSCSSSDSC